MLLPSAYMNFPVMVISSISQFASVMFVFYRVATVICKDRLIYLVAVLTIGYAIIILYTANMRVFLAS